MDLKGVEMTWLGHSAFRFELPDGTIVYVDPWLTGNPACPETEQRPERVDAVFITHGHFDHLGDMLALGSRLGPHAYCNFEISIYLEGKGIPNVVGLNKGGTVEGPGGVRGTMVDAVHSSGILDGGKIVDGGDPGGWVLDFPGGLRLYHAGDTMPFGDMRIIGELFHPDIALLPIGGHFVMDPVQAAYAAGLLGITTVVPIHFGTFPVLAGTPEQLQAAGPGLEVVDLKVGDG